MAAYRARVEAAPARESELTELTRDYQTLQESYNSLLAKSQDSEIAANLERQQVGQRFHIIEPATLPGRPLSPDRRRINGMGALGGFVFSVLLVALLEYRDTTLKTDGDVAASMALPVLAVIPQMMTAGTRWTDRRKLVAAVGATAVVVVAGSVVLAWKLQLLESWMR
jgi:capsular polysaccharide biosynthesis protein